MALELLEKRLGISEEIGDLKGQALAWDYRGNFHYTRGEHGLAESAFRKALELAEKANLRTLALSEEMRVPEMVVECRLLATKILSRKDRPAAEAALRHLLREPMDDEQRAEVHRIIYELSGDEASRQQALKAYRRLNERNPTEEYAQMIARLEKIGP
jgi:tetratricopeptide (TPR) repeat protein